MVSDSVAWKLGDKDIAVKELAPIVMAASTWSRCWSGKHIRFHSRQHAVVATLNRTAKTPSLMHLLQRFSFYCAYYQFSASAEHCTWGQEYSLSHPSYSTDTSSGESSLCSQATGNHQARLGVNNLDTSLITH